MKGGICLSATGYIQVHAYTSNAQIPLKDVSVVITGTDGDAIAMRLTNRSGTLDEPVPIEVPNASASQTPDTGIIPFTSVDLYARLQDYEEIFIENLQVLPGIVTNQKLELIPLSEFPQAWNKTEIFTTPTQQL